MPVVLPDAPVPTELDLLPAVAAREGNAHAAADLALVARADRGSRLVVAAHPDTDEATLVFLAGLDETAPVLLVRADASSRVADAVRRSRWTRNREALVAAADPTLLAHLAQADKSVSVRRLARAALNGRGRPGVLPGWISQPRVFGWEDGGVVVR